MLKLMRLRVCLKCYEPGIPSIKMSRHRKSGENLELCSNHHRTVDISKAAGAFVM